MKKTHQPKGGQCLACERSCDDCSMLQFETMTPLETCKDGMIIVKCSEFKSLKM